MTSIDERDHIIAGFLMKGGQKLYSDFFTNHFPFLYYWIAFFARFWGNSFSRAISVFRLSVGVFYAISFLSIFLFSKNSKTKISLSFWILLLSLFMSLYHGNLVLSETFAAIVIFSIFWLIIPILLNWEKPSTAKSILLVFFASIGFWTQPLLIVLFPAILLITKKNKIFLISFLSFLINLFPLIYFYFSKQLLPFWEQTIRFNFSIYPKYYPYLERFYSDSSFLQYFLSFTHNEFYLFTHLGFPHQFIQFIFHLSAVTLLIVLLKKKKLKYFLPFLIILLSTRMREVKIVPGKIFNFGIFPFLCLSSASFALLIIEFGKKQKFLSLVITISVIIAGFIGFKPILLQSLKPGYNYHVFWSYRQDLGKIINDLSLPDEKVLVYPHDVDLYFFSQRRPIDRFSYWFPWIDSVDKYRNERLTALKNTPPSVIYMGNLTFKDDLKYYGKLFPNLLINYLPIVKEEKTTGIWLRSDLKDRLGKEYSILKID